MIEIKQNFEIKDGNLYKDGVLVIGKNAVPKKTIVEPTERPKQQMRWKDSSYMTDQQTKDEKFQIGMEIR